MSSKFISIDLAHNFISNSGAFIIDVRTPDEFCTGHLCGAFNIETKLPPLDKNDLKKLEKRLKNIGVNKYHPIVVYCKKGIRAAHAKKILERLGYKYVFNLGGVETEPLKKYLKKPTYKDMKICRCI